jgi:hypothetical protein
MVLISNCTNSRSNCFRRWYWYIAECRREVTEGARKSVGSGAESQISEGAKTIEKAVDEKEVLRPSGCYEIYHSSELRGAP